MNQIVLLVFPHGVRFVEQQNLNYMKASPKQNNHNSLGVTPFHLLPLLDTLTIRTWLSVMPIFPLPVYENGIMCVSHIAKYTCDKSVIM